MYSVTSLLLKLWRTFLGAFYVHGSVRRESVSIIVQQAATLYSFYFLQTAQNRVLIPQRQRKVAYGSISARCCNYSLLAHLMMGEDIARIM
jgi:hypothetical protein